MPARKTRPSAGRARLTVLATTDDAAFLAYALVLLASKQRLDREAAVQALAERPHPRARDALRAFYLELHAGSPKSDRGGDQRGAILRYLLHQPHRDDSEIAIKASRTVESDSMGADITYNLRLLGLRLLAHVLSPDVLRYYAAEHLDDVSPHNGEPAATAIDLLADTGSHATIYHWLLGADRESPNLLRAFEALTDAPPEIVRQYVEREMASAVRTQNESACIVFAEAIVRLELAQAYPALAMTLSAKISDELFGYLAVLLARTNRPPLLAILEEHLRPGGRTRPILEALGVRTTPEQQAIIDRWERRDD